MKEGLLPIDLSVYHKTRLRPTMKEKMLLLLLLLLLRLLVDLPIHLPVLPRGEKTLGAQQSSERSPNSWRCDVIAALEIYAVKW